MMKTEELLPKMKFLLDYDELDDYDEKLKILINGAISKLQHEGVKNIYEDGTIEADDYAICLSYQVAVDGGFDVDLERMRALYLDRVVTLRESQLSN